MNRERERKFMQLAKKKGVSKSLTELYIEIQKRAARKEIVPAQDLEDGERVRLNVEMIQRHPDYPRLSERYRSFVETHADDIFTVERDESFSKQNALVTLREAPEKWLFWSGDLLKTVEKIKE